MNINGATIISISENKMGIGAIILLHSNKDWTICRNSSNYKVYCITIAYISMDCISNA